MLRFSVTSAANRQKSSTQSIKTFFPPAVISRIKSKRQRMHCSVLLLLQLFAFSASASPLGHLLPLNTGDDPSDTASYAEQSGFLYQVAGGLVPDKQPAQFEVNTPLNQLAQPFACTTQGLTEPACCPQNVYIPADPSCIPYSRFPGKGCERNDGVGFRGACCHGFDSSGGIMCQDPSVTTNIPQVTYEKFPSQQPAPNPLPNQQLLPTSGTDEPVNNP